MTNSHDYIIGTPCVDDDSNLWRVDICRRCGTKRRLCDGIGLGWDTVEFYPYDAVYPETEEPPCR